MVSQRYRADFYLFRQFLLGLGAFRNRRVSSCDSVKLIFGVNRPFKIRLEGSWLKARAALLDSETPHYLNGRGDWQAILWIDSGTALASVLRREALKDRPWAVHTGPQAVFSGDVVQTAADKPDAPGALALADRLIYTYTGARPVPATWDRRVKEAFERLEDDPGRVTVRGLAEELGRDVEELDEDVRRVMGEGLDAYLHRRKMDRYFELRQDGIVREQALRDAGLADLFESRYGLSLADLEEGKPFLRVHRGPPDQPCLYI